jgi:hypothetical protein
VSGLGNNLVEGRRLTPSPGVHPFRDYRTGVWNFSPEFHDIPHPSEYAFDRSPKYVTPSKDVELLALAEKEQCRFIGSTSTLTQALSQIYFAISGMSCFMLRTSGCY